MIIGQSYLEVVAFHDKSKPLADQANILDGYK